MLTALRSLCQTAPWLCVAFVLFAARSSLRAEPSPPPPSEPAWKQELGAASIVETALALADAPADDPRARRLADAYQKLAVKYPDQAEVQRACGDYYAGAGGQPDQAFRCWERAQALAPNDPEIADTLGSAQLARGHVREAAAQFQRAVDAQPASSAYHFSLANVLYLFRHEIADPAAGTDAEAVLVRALEHFRRATELAPDDRRLAQAYAETFYLLAHPDWAAALGAWQAVLALSGTDTDFANGHLARISLKLGQGDNARRYIARITGPAFTTLKAKLTKQADGLTAPKP